VKEEASLCYAGMRVVDDQSVLWRRLDKPGHEFGRLFFLDSQWHLGGTAVFLHDRMPTQLAYEVVCDSNWQTLSGKVAGWVGGKAIEIEISVDSDHRWRLNGKEYAEVAGCIDLDLNFSPSTNLLPIRRLCPGHRAGGGREGSLASFPRLHSRTTRASLPPN
jgi:hypothetical protein